ncbi:MAG: TetR family transcriptional regulator C-terminal domain-containing protein [Actinobacteria bacterium]|nr:TetR family transcriptional regulator C-terminal domain-containing protein [Actinomycetota bacterium]
MPRFVDVEERRVELTDAAARLIARAGIGAATMREVAAEAGLSTGSLTHYFADKRELLLCTFQASLSGRRSQRAERAPDAASQLRATLEGALPVDDDRRRHWMVTVAFCAQAAGDDELADAQRDAYREFRSHVARQVERAGIADGDRAVVVAERFIAAVDGVAIQALFDPESWPAERQLAALDDLLRA